VHFRQLKYLLLHGSGIEMRKIFFRTIASLLLFTSNISVAMKEGRGDPFAGWSDEPVAMTLTEIASGMFLVPYDPHEANNDETPQINRSPVAFQDEPAARLSPETAVAMESIDDNSMESIDDDPSVDEAHHPVSLLAASAPSKVMFRTTNKATSNQRSRRQVGTNRSRWAQGKSCKIDDEMPELKKIIEEELEEFGSEGNFPARAIAKEWKKEHPDRPVLSRTILRYVETKIKKPIAQRAGRSGKIANNKTLRAYIISQSRKGVSHDKIARTWSQENPDYTITQQSVSEFLSRRRC